VARLFESRDNCSLGVRSRKDSMGLCLREMRTPFRMLVKREATRWIQSARAWVKSADKSLQTMSMSTELSISRTMDGSGSGCVKGSEVWREEGRWKSDRRLGRGGRAELWHQGPTPAGLPAAPTLPQSRVSPPHAQKKEGKVKKNRMGELGPVRLSKG